MPVAKKSSGKVWRNSALIAAFAQAAFVQTLAPIELTLRNHAYLGGATANYSDYPRFGSLKWGPMLQRGLHFCQAIRLQTQWFEQTLDLHDACGGMPRPFEVSLRSEFTSLPVRGCYAPPSDLRHGGHIAHTDCAIVPPARHCFLRGGRGRT